MAALVAGGRPHKKRRQIARYATLTPQTFAVRACTIALSELKIRIQSERLVAPSPCEQEPSNTRKRYMLHV